MLKFGSSSYVESTSYVQMQNKPHGPILTPERPNSKYGRLNFKKFTRKIWSLGPEICTFAAKGGHLDILKWLRENG